MNEYTNAYLKPFEWARRAYEYMLGISNNANVTLDINNLTAPSLPTIPTEPINIFTDADWNLESRNQISVLGALYQSIDQAELYYNSLYTLISSRMAESESRIQEQDSNLRVLLSASKNVASTASHIKGGDSTLIDSNDKYYKSFGPLEAVPNEGIFRLKDTGAFSSIRSLGNFSGQVFIEFSLGQLVQNGALKSITDGTRNTFWSGTFYTPAPIKADQNDIPWLPDEYKHGFAFLLTYYMDSPTLATEVYVEPVITEPMDLVSISWTPMSLTNAISNGTFTTSGNWSYASTTSFVSSALGQGVASGGCLVAYSSSGYASQTFSVSGSLLASGASALVSPGHRCHIQYDMRGRGDTYAGVRIVWLNASGDVIDYKLKEDYPTGFYIQHRLIDFVPTGATSGRIDVGIFTPSTNASAYFDNVTVILGEKEFQVNETIDRPKTISFPEIARSGRYSFVFAQRNPRREVLAKEAASLDVTPIESNSYLDSTLQATTQRLTNKLANVGPGTSLFSYRVGMKELDLRYREHIPRGSLVSLPLYTRKEIREVWITAELGQFFNDNTKFYVYPFADSPEIRTEIEPFIIGDVDHSTTTTIGDGEILKIYTFEEQACGWTNTLEKSYVTDPKLTRESFDGTDRDGKIKLSYAPHLRRVYLKEISDWITSHSIWPAPFDPNLETMYGLPTSSISTIDSIRNGTASGFDLDDLIAREGYLPLKVTIQTDKWTAVPDIYGRPDISKVRTVLLEELTATTVVETTVENKSDYTSFEVWLNTPISKSQLLIHNSKVNPSTWGFDGVLTGKLNRAREEDKTLQQVLDSIVKYNGHINQRLLDVYTGQLRRAYDKLKADGKLPKDSTKTHTITSAVEAQDVFATRFKPIITGSRGSFLKLYWYDPTAVVYIPMSQSDYEVSNATLGLIKVLSSAPASSYTSVLADYKYISYSETEDHFGSIITFAAPTSSVSSIVGNVTIGSKPLPITRNMTDYENGKIPTLRQPNFDRLAKDYYPVIEYYVNNSGELIFSRDFFRYGDIPAKVLVEYLTLAIQPRVGAEVTRSGSPAATPTIFNLSMRVRESSPLPIRESE